MDVLEGLQQIRGEMDRYVVGHDDVKEAVMLGLIAREHIYLEGPPGTAKTMLAEITSEAADLKFFFYQLHRDTRLAELVGPRIGGADRGCVTLAAGRLDPDHRIDR